jgi:hypothetical protein
VNEDSTLISCGGECLCFCVTGFFCIFCFHPMIFQFSRDKMLNEYVFLLAFFSCFSHSLAPSLPSLHSFLLLFLNRSTLRNLNRDYFQNYPVLFCTPSGNVLINLSALPPSSVIQTRIHAQAQPAGYYSSTEYVQQPVYATPYSPQHFPPVVMTTPSQQTGQVDSTICLS